MQVLTFCDNSLQSDHSAEVNTPQCPGTDCILTKTTLEANVEGGVPYKVSFFDLVVCLYDDVGESKVKAGQEFVWLIQECSSVFSVV